MGALIPIGQGADAEIKSRLNNAFSGQNLALLQANQATENLFDGNHTLQRVAYRLGCYPQKSGYLEPSRAKWFYFLQNTLPAANKYPAAAPITTTQAIKNMLLYALNPANNITRVVFEAVEDKAASCHYVYPDNVKQTVHGSTMHILLICPAPLVSTNTAADPTQPDTVAGVVNGPSVETAVPPGLPLP